MCRITSRARKWRTNARRLTAQRRMRVRGPICARMCLHWIQYPSFALRPPDGFPSRSCVGCCFRASPGRPLNRPPRHLAHCPPSRCQVLSIICQFAQRFPLQRRQRCRSQRGGLAEAARAFEWLVFGLGAGLRLCEPFSCNTSLAAAAPRRRCRPDAFVGILHHMPCDDRV